MPGFGQGAAVPDPTPLPEAIRGRAFSRAEFAATGGWLGRLRADDLERPYPGVRSPTPVSTLLDRCRAYSVRMHPHHFFSHVTAALLVETPLPRRLEERTVIDVATVMPAQKPRVAEVEGHRLRVAPERWTVSGLTAVVPPEAWCQIAPQLTLDDLVIAADHMLNLLADPERARRAFEQAVERPHRPDRSRLRAALGEARAGTRSPGETRVRLLLMRAGTPEPRLNVTIWEDGIWLGAPDLSWAQYRVAVEYEGDQHFTKRKQYRDDVDRYALLADAGWIVIRAISDDLTGYRARLLIDRVQRALAR